MHPSVKEPVGSVCEEEVNLDLANPLSARFNAVQSDLLMQRESKLSTEKSFHCSFCTLLLV